MTAPWGDRFGAGEIPTQSGRARKTLVHEQLLGDSPSPWQRERKPAHERAVDPENLDARRATSVF
jgi:hypothetical protein